MDYNFKLESFEGPLDLLLHLIEKNKVDIYDIPIALITEQYLEAIAQMPDKDLDSMSEFLLMASTLLEIKAHMLLPREEEEEEEGDPRAELVARLLEYKKYKLLSAQMRSLEEGSDKLWYRAQDLPQEVAKYKPPVDLDHLLKNETAEKLQRIFDEIMRRQSDRTDEVHSHFGEIEREAVQIGDRLDYVKERVRKPGRHSFRSLLGSSATKLEIVITFLAILELIKTGEIRLSEDSTRDDFTLEDNAA
ncbi:MAG: segregation/condensation protein A [Lachnospiraceae bacterium]|nr:segregation/condensation protein A [Lachnospiraceae bacterium]